MAQKDASTPDGSIVPFLLLCVLLEARDGTTSQSRIEHLANLSLTELPPLVSCKGAPTPHIQILEGAQLVVPYFATPNPEYGKILAFTRNIQGDQMLASVKFGSP